MLRFVFLFPFISSQPYLQQRSPQPRGGQSSQGQHDAGNRDRMNQTRNQNLPDFGDRYSANRTKDRLRREQQNKGHLPSDGQKSENPRDRNPGGPRGGPGGDRVTSSAHFSRRSNPGSPRKSVSIDSLHQHAQVKLNYCKKVFFFLIDLFARDDLVFNEKVGN